MARRISTLLAVLVLSTLFVGCSSTRLYYGGEKRVDPATVRLFMPPFFNATDDDHASRAVTELTASALLERRIPLVQTEPALVKARIEGAPGPDGLFIEAARSLQATHLLIGTVHEYRYKTDLDGDPAVGFSMRLVDVKEGRTLWQGSSARVSVMFASLSTASQRAIRDLVDKMPILSRPVQVATPTVRTAPASKEPPKFRREPKKAKRT